MDDEAPALRAIVAEDDPMVRRLLRDTLQRGNVTVVADATTGREAVELALFYRPDVVVHHWPSAARDPRRRRIQELRNHVLIGWLRRPLAHALAELNKRIHVLEGFAKVYDALDEILAMIRKSDGKADAKGKLVERFGLDEDQAEAILERAR